MTTTIYPLPASDPSLDGTIRLLYKALGTRSPRAAIDNFNTVSSHKLQANSFKLTTIIRLEDLKDTEYYYPIVDIIDNGRGLFILYTKEYIEFTKVVFYIIDPFVLTVRGGRYIDKIDLHPLKETYNNNRFKRAFRLA